MLGLANRISFSLGTRSIGGGSVSPTSWQDDGSGGINNPWNDDDYWNETGGAVTRNFTTSALGGSQSWPLDSSVELTGDFVIQDTIWTGSTAAGTLISGGVSAGNLEISLTSAGLVKVALAGSTVLTGIIAVNDNKKTDIILSRSGTTASLFINGVADGTGTMAGTVNFDTFNARTGGTIFFIGTQSDIIVLDEDVITGLWLIDEADPSTIVDRANGNNSTAVNFTSAQSETFTNESVRWTSNTQLAVNPDFDTDTIWSKGVGWSISGGNAIHTAPTTSNIGQPQGANLIEGDTVKCIYDLVSLSGNNCRVLYGGLIGDLNTANVIGLNTELATWGSQVGNNLNIQAFTTAEAVISSLKLFRTLEEA